MTAHTSHVARHTPHVTHHTSQVTRHTSHVTSQENISTRTRPRGYVEAVRAKGTSYEAAADKTRMSTASAIEE